MLAESLANLLREITVKVVEPTLGTAFWVNANQLLTCFHVIRPSGSSLDEPIVVTWNGLEVRAAVSLAEETSDLAILDILTTGLPTHPHALMSGLAAPGDQLYTFGYTHDYPNGEPATPELEGISGKPVLMKLKGAQISPGMSGAPLLNLRTGAVCGVIRRTRDRHSDLGGRAIPMHVVFDHFDFLDGQQSALQLAETDWEKQISEEQRSLIRGEKYRESFTGQVAELYRLLHYAIDYDYEVGARTVDLFLKRRIGDLSILRIVNTRPDHTTTSDVEELALTVKTARRQFPNIHGAIVSASSFSEDVRRLAEAEGIGLTIQSDLETQLLDGHAYARRLIRECEHNTQYRMDLYVEPDTADEFHGAHQRANHLIESWLRHPDWQQLTLLGDVGTGKTFLTRVLAHRLAKAYLAKPATEPLPIRIDLRNADRQFTIEGLLLSHFATSGLDEVTFDVFQHSFARGRVLLILDGFDEMAARVTPRIAARNFEELARVVQGSGKMLLTCRTHFFRSRSEEEEVVLGPFGDLSSESVRELYWDLVSRKGFSIAYLRPFGITQVEAYVRRSKGAEANITLKKIRGIYNLLELCQRPMLLDMIVRSIDQIDAKDVSAAELYKVFTNAWILRDKWRSDFLSSRAKLRFVQALARSLWTYRATAIHYSDLADFLDASFAESLRDPRQHVEIDHEIRTASFLTRDEEGNYGFAHKSYREFFLARHLATELQEGNVECLDIDLLIPEIGGFLLDMIDAWGSEVDLEAILTGEYRKRISENVLLVLYWRHRRHYDQLGDDKEKRIQLPDGAMLQGAQLAQANLGRVSLRNAFLRNADLEETVFVGADLTGTDMSFVKAKGADMAAATLEHACLEGASFVESDFEGANAQWANLTRADFTGATTTRFACGGANLSYVRFLQTEVARDLAVAQEGAEFADAVKSFLPVSILSDQSILDPVTYALLRKIARMVARQYSFLDEIDAEDLVGTFWLRYATGRRVDEEKLRDRAFINATMRNIAISEGRRIRRRWETPIGGTNEVDSLLVSDVDTVSEAADVDHVVEALLNVMKSTLSEKVYRLAQRSFIEGATSQEIASEEGMTEAAVRQALYVARKKLRQNPELQDLIS